MTTTNPLRQLNAAGQSVWYDNIHRAMLGAELQRLIDGDDLRGITSNPAIFEKAITGSKDYDAALLSALQDDPNQSNRELFFALAIDDIRAAADQLLPVYQATGGVDGMVSLEVSPDLADDTEATIQEARGLQQKLQRDNVMIKVPATEAGLPAIEQLTADGININVTLLFAIDRYQAVAESYLAGLERRLQEDLPIDRVVSVASFFVSRVDAAIDPLLQKTRPELAGQVAIANAKLAFQACKETFSGERFATLAAAGAHVQRLLWASTATKNPDYPELKYVEALIGRDTVDTLPPATYASFRQSGKVAHSLETDLDAARATLAALPGLGIDLAEVTERLEHQGVAAFADSFDNLLAAIDAKTAQLAA